MDVMKSVISFIRKNQSEDMALLECQTMPSVHEVAHDGVLCTHLVTDQPQIGGKWCGPSGQAAWTVHRVQNHTSAGSLSSSQPGGPPCWASL
jgi:hypothetical protein